MERLNSVVKPSPRAVRSWSEKFEVTAVCSLVKVSLHEWSINQGLEILAHHRALFHSRAEQAGGLISSSEPGACTPHSLAV